MKNTITIFLFSFGFVLNIQAQNNRLKDSIMSRTLALSHFLDSSPTENAIAIEINRIKRKSFSNQTLNYAPLSYASPPFSELGSPKNGYILSADVSPHFVIGGKWIPTPIHLTARYKVRIFKDNEDEGDRSLPVRTPSFMPGATIFLPLQKFLNDYSQTISYLGLSFFHHSNGQDGNERLTNGTLNLYNGNFSTNYFEIAYHERYRFGPKFSAYAAKGYNDILWRIGYEHHIATATPLKSTYGGHRINLNGTWINVRSYSDKVADFKTKESYLRELFRVTFNNTVIMSRREMGLSTFKKRINTELSFHYRIPSSPNTSLFLEGGYYGSDPYNIYYEQSYALVRFGVALGFFVTPNLLGIN